MAKLPELEEAQLKIDTINMYKVGGAYNVLDCVHTMQQAQIVILTKLNDILEEEEKK